jgi:hypothetical protein
MTLEEARVLIEQWRRAYNLVVIENKLIIEYF